MVVNFIKCPHCHEEINAFYACVSHCPSCQKTFASAWVCDSGKGLEDIKEDRREYKNQTMSKYQIKKMFNLTDKEISKIPSSNNFGMNRYKKTDVIKYI